MAEMNKTPKPSGNSGGGSRSEQKANAEHPKSAEQGQISAEVNKDARKWVMFCHLAGLAGYVMPIVGNIVAPLIIWQIKKDEHSFVDEQGKEAVNFQISMSLYALIGIAVCLITCVGAVLIPVVAIVVGIFDLVFLLIAAVKANSGRHYRYPLTIRFIK
jgi:uncharacterized Tic20 family protein